MSVTTPSASDRQFPGDLLWPVLLAVAAVGGSLAFACITPFAAFAALAAWTQNPRGAFATSALIWAANQAVGFAFLGYPADVPTLLWGLAIGAGVMLATYAAILAMARLGGINRFARLALAFVAAFAAYQLAIVAAALVLGDIANCAPGLMLDYAAIDAAWLIGMAALCEILARLGWPKLKSLIRPA